jgi:acetyltransferase
MAAEDRLVDGMLRQGGMVRIRDYTQLIHMAKALSMIALPKGNRVGFLAPSGAMLVVLSDLCNRLGLAVPELLPESIQRLQEISPPFIRMRNPIDIWASASTRGVEFAYREGLEVLLRDPMIDAVVVVFMLTRETGIPKYGFVVDLAKKYPQKPVLVTFSADKSYMEKARRYLEPKGVPTFIDIEQPFEVIALLSQCYEAMHRPSWP